MSHWPRTNKKRKMFLDQLEVGNSVSFAAAAAGGSARQFKRWKEEDDSFAKDWEEAEDAGTDFLEDAATSRALKSSDTLAMFLLKARRPEKYDRNSGKSAVEVNINVEGSKAKLLNKIARLQAQGQLSQMGQEEEQAVLEGSDGAQGETPLLPAPADPGLVKGRKRRRAVEGSGREQTA